MSAGQWLAFMADGLHSKRLSLDTNVLLDIAARRDFAVGFKDAFQARGYGLYFAPTVAAELNNLSEKGDDQERDRAGKALDSLILWDIAPMILTDVEKKYRANFMTFVEDRSILPAGERNDARILAETAIAQIPMLITSDRGILEADGVALAMAFEDAGLHQVRFASPRALWKSYGRTAPRK